ncbi:MAG: response regulator [Bacteroidales bacterium]|nr:response regulator [Bacteroidales bacterium]
METKSKILIVDDDSDVINVLKTILEHEGYDVYPAYNKTEALETAARVKPDLAILDVMMTTHYEGFELAKTFGESSEFQSMPVVMQTSIEVLTTTNLSVQQMAKEYRKDRKYKELQVLLVKDILKEEAGIDYLSEEGVSLWVPVQGFVKKPVDSNNLLPIISRLLKH